MNVKTKFKVGDKVIVSAYTCMPKGSDTTDYLPIGTRTEILACLGKSPTTNSKGVVDDCYLVKGDTRFTYRDSELVKI